MKSQFVISPVNAGTTIKKLVLIPRDQDRFIPANLIGNRNVTSLVISCHLQNTKSNYINLDRDAFMASNNSLVDLTIETCNLMNLDWSFLTGFVKLDTLNILYCSNFQLTIHTLPPLKTFSTLIIESMVISTSVPEIVKLPTLAKGLTGVSVS